MDLGFKLKVWRKAKGMTAAAAASAIGVPVRTWQNVEAGRDFPYPDLLELALIGHSQKPDLAVLFARSDSIYKGIANVDVYDAHRDARTYTGDAPVIAHPPCRAWGMLRKFANPRKGERALAIFAIRQVRRCGGVLEHPAHSTLWTKAKLPRPGQSDEHGGYTLDVHQLWWGHRADKRTWLYVCGVDPSDIPKAPIYYGEATHTIGSNRAMTDKPSLQKKLREATPSEFALWLCQLARKARAAKINRPAEKTRRRPCYPIPNTRGPAVDHPG